MTGSWWYWSSSIAFYWVSMGPWHPVPVAAMTTFPLIPQHTQRARRRTLLSQEESMSSVERGGHTSVRRREEAQQIGALYQGYGTHYVDLWCGTPRQRQTVIVDTGSGATAFPCSECNQCGSPKYHIDELFDEESSETFRWNTCQEGCIATRSRCTQDDDCRLTMAYAEGSRWDAYEGIDNCYIGGPHEFSVEDDGGTDALDPRHVVNFDLIFGCQFMITGLFKTQLADGIMGMDARPESFWYQMYNAGKLGDKKQFSLCYSRADIAERKGSEAGALTLGGIDERFNTSPVVYTPDSDGGRDGFFSVQVRKVWMREGSAGESAASKHANPNIGIRALQVPQSDLNTGGIIVDSGTTDTYWNKAISKAFQAAFKEMTGFSHSNSPISLTHDELLALPTVLFQLQSSEEVNGHLDSFKTPGLAGALDTKHPYDVILAFPPTHYMEYDVDSKKYTSRFYVSENRGSVLGANAMMGHNILFNVDQNTIGWAESECAYTKLVHANGFEFEITGELRSPQPVDNDHNTAFAAAPKPEATSSAHVPEPLPGNNPNKSSNKTPAMKKAEVKESLSQLMETCVPAKCRIPVGLGLMIVFCMGGCMSYILMCCCFSYCRGGRQTGKYAQQGARANGVELVGFRDELSDDEDDEDDDEVLTSDDDEENEDKPIRNGNGTKPEFQGDFI